jgi:hypothetical protein
MTSHLPRLLCLLIVCAVGSRANAQTALVPAFSARVSIDVTAPQSIHSAISSYLTRELRELQGVQVVDSAAGYVLTVVAIETKSRGGQPTGVAMAVHSASVFDSALVGWVLQMRGEKLAESSRKAVDLLTSRLQNPGQLELYVGADDDLKVLCERIVASFDTEMLEKRRRSWEESRQNAARGSTP